MKMNSLRQILNSTLKIIFTAFLLFFSSIPFLNAETRTVTPTEQYEWLRHLLPLPHEISIQNKLILEPDKLSIVVRPGASDIERNAAREIEELFREKTGAVPSGDAFTIIIGTLENNGKLNGIPVREHKRLEMLPNNDQAYIIQPNGDTSLLLTGLHGKGVYYAAVTLCQLLEPYMTTESVTIPLADVLDWPDMEERGLWNFPQLDEWIPWMSSLKLNYGKMVNTKLQKIERGKTNHAVIDRELMIKARTMGFNYLPFILHLNFLHGYGLFKAYPELAGIGDSALAGRYFAHKLGSQHRAPCADNPLLTKILTEWMMDIASQDADEVSCWLTERPAQCGHKKCRETGQFVLEARAFVNAWRETRKTYPEFTIRLFISTTTDERYYKVLAETPPEVKIERCCSADLERVRHLPRDLYINPMFDFYAAYGRWTANYDVPIGAFGRVETPEFKVPCSSAHRIRNFVSQLINRGYRGAYGMMGWGSVGVETCGFNINALAEWSWNRNGRSEKEFAAAWATRQDYGNPDAVGEWSEIMGPVEFDVYESDFPTCYSWGKFVSMVDERKLPCPGEGIFRYYRSREDFDIKIADCERALAIAKKFDTPDLANETKVILSYVKLAKYIYEVAEQVAAEDLSTLESQEKLRSSLKHLESAGKDIAETIREWRSAIGPEPWHYRVHDAIDAVETTVNEIKQIVAGKYLY